MGKRALSESSKLRKDGDGVAVLSFDCTARLQPRREHRREYIVLSGPFLVSRTGDAG
jgi:hypothetical protein